MDAVVENAEEEDEVEGLELLQLRCSSQIAEDKAVRALQLVRPLLVQVPVGGEVREDEL